MTLLGCVRWFGLACVIAIVEVPHALGASEPKDFEICLADDANSDVSAELARAVRDCTKALANPQIDDAARSELLVHRGVAFRNLGDNTSSYADLCEAVRLSPKSAGALRMLAWTLRGMNRLEEAEADYDRSLSLEREWQGLLSRCVVRIDLKKLSDALADCREALKLQRNSDSLYFTAWLYSQYNELHRAITLLEEARKLADASPRIFDLLASAYLSEGHQEAAAQIVREGLMRFPDDPSLQDRQGEIARAVPTRDL